MTDPYWTRLRIAEHEATHAVVAQKMGLHVAWVTIEPGHDEDIGFAAAVKIPEETLDYERDALAICVAMAAPAELATHEGTDIGFYAEIEARVAYRMAAAHGIEFDDVYDRCVDIVGEEWEAICDLTQRLLDEGKVVFDHAYV